MSKKLFLLDAYALIFRSYYAFIRNPRFNSKGLNTSAIFGFTNTLIEILQKEDPSYIAVVFDPPGPNFRHEMYAEYKANRDATPEDIKLSIPYIKKIIGGFNIPIVMVDGYEADDVIGSLANKHASDKTEVYMMTPDKDYGQVISDRIYMYKPARGGKNAEVITREKLCEKYGIDKPEQIIDILALMGDSSDNIPGAPGIGEKTAQKLIQKYKTVENLYEHIDDLKGKQKENLVNNKQQVELSKKLVTFAQNIPLDIRLDELNRKDPDQGKLKDVFDELEFRTIYARLFNSTAKSNASPQQGSLFDSETPGYSSSFQTIEDVPHKYHLADTSLKVEELADLLSKQDEFCFDTETSGLNVHRDNLIGLSFSWKKGEAWYVPVDQNREKAIKLLSEFKSVFENKHILKIGQNIKFDILVLKYYGIETQGPLFDTMVAHYLISPELRHNMDYLAGQYLNYKPVEIESLIGKKGKNQGSMRNVPLEQLKEYACEDADITWQLKDILEKELKDKNLVDLAENIEFPLIYVLASMEFNGFKIESKTLNNYSQELSKELVNIEEKIHKMAGVDFNISSPKQLGEVLFDHLKIDPKAKKTKTKQYVTNEETLSKLTDKHPIVDQILEFRGLKKLLSTYVDALPGLINESTGKIHSSFNQTITATGRLSSTNPNLQNIPIREERGKEIRKSFVPSDDDHTLLAADYSQIELRIMSHLSQDQSMMKAFKNNEDIHTTTAAKIFHVEPEKVTADMRRKAKTANFGIIYGISAFGLSQRLNISRSEAKELIDGYFESFPAVKEYMNKSIEEGRKNGHVKTLFGRIKSLPDINSRNSLIRGNAERTAINAPIQGTAADIIKIAMIDIYGEFVNNNYKSRMILQVHDELVFDVHKSELEELKKLIKNMMENAVQLNIPLTVDIGTGANWLEAH